MSATIISTDTPLAAPPLAELLNNAPFPGLFQATVLGVDENGEQFEANVRLDGHLNGDLYLRLCQRLELWSALFIVLRLAPALDNSLPSVRVALHGKINSITPVPGGCDVRVSILDYQKL
jgi:hypothetical protein